MKSAEPTLVASALSVPENTVNYERLSQLTKSAEISSPSEAGADSEPAAKVEHANEKLWSLLGKPK